MCCGWERDLQGRNLGSADGFLGISQMHRILFQVAELVLKKEVILMKALSPETVQIRNPEPWLMYHLNYSGFVQVNTLLRMKSYQERWGETPILKWFIQTLSVIFILVQNQMH